MNARTVLGSAAFATALVAVAVACGGPQVPDAANVTPAVPSASAAPAASSAAPAAPAKMTAAECDALVDDANVALDADRISVEKPCKKDADCVAIKGRACTFKCQNGAIPKAEEADWNTKMGKVRDNQCKKWADNDCAKTSPPKTPATCPDDAKKAACVKSKCVLK